MNINLSAEQEKFIQFKIKTGKYRSSQEVLENALRLLDEYDRTLAQWNDEVKEKIEEAIKISDNNSLIDGESFLNEIIERFAKASQ